MDIVYYRSVPVRRFYGRLRFLIVECFCVLITFNDLGHLIFNSLLHGRINCVVKNIGSVPVSLFPHRSLDLDLGISPVGVSDVVLDKMFLRIFTLL